MLDADRMVRQIVQAGEEWADKESAADLLEETKRTILAELMTQQEQGMSVAAKEQLSLADPAYKLHLTNMVAARKEANRARVRYDALKVLAELRRSEESTRRAEMGMR